MGSSPTVCVSRQATSDQCILLHHCPGAEKRKRKGIKEEDLDAYCRGHIRRLKRYGEAGAILVALLLHLQTAGHHVYGDNAFSSAQVAYDMLQGGTAEHGRFPPTHYTGTQSYSKKSKDKKKKKKDGDEVDDGVESMLQTVQDAAELLEDDVAMNFAQYKNLPRKNAAVHGNIKKYGYRSWTDKTKRVSFGEYYDKKKVHWISNFYGGKQLVRCYRVRSKKKERVVIQKAIEKYNMKKV